MFEPLNIIIRVILAFLFLFVATKLLTKRSLANLTYFDHIATMTLGTLAGNLAFNIKIHILNFILSMIVITLIIMLVSYVSFKYRSFRKFWAGNPTTIIKNGKILEQNMSNFNYSDDYLKQQLRQKNVFNISEVKLAILEPNGELSVEKKSQYQPVTPHDIILLKENERGATEIVLEGKILRDSLKKNGLTQQWLDSELRKKGIDNINTVAFAVLATNGNLYVEQYHD